MSEFIPSIAGRKARFLSSAKARRSLSTPYRSIAKDPVHRYGGIEFVVADDRELGHLHGHGLLDVWLDRAKAHELIAGGQVLPHHLFPNSGWISYQLESAADVPFAVALLQAAQNR